MWSRGILEEAGRKGTDITGENNLGVSSINSHNLFSLKVWRKLYMALSECNISCAYTDAFTLKQNKSSSSASQKWSRCTSLNCSTHPLPGCTKFGIVAPFWPPHAAASKTSLNGWLHTQPNKLPGQQRQHKSRDKELLPMTWRCWCPR